MLKVRCTEGERFELRLEYKGKSVTAYSDNRLEKGKKRVSSKEDVENQLLRFGNTPFDPQIIELKILMMTYSFLQSLVNKTRRKAVSMFSKQLKKTVRRMFLSI